MCTEKWFAYTLSSVVIIAGLLAWRNNDGAVVASVENRSAPAAAPISIAPPQTAAKQVAMPAPADEPSLSEQIDRLIATRDPEKAMAAYRLVKDCAVFNRDKDRLTFDMAELKGGWKGDSLPGFRGMTEPEKQHDRKLCGGMTEHQRRSGLDYLAIALKAKVWGSAMAFAVEGPFGDPTALKTRPNDPLVQEWRTQAIAQLTSAAEEHAELGVLSMLWAEYANGSDLLEKNALLAYRYGMATGLIYRDILGADNPTTKVYLPDSPTMMAFARGFSPEEIAAQVAVAERIAANAKAMRKRKGWVR